MFKRLSFILAPLLLSACATTYDPAQVCTAEWIQPRAMKAAKSIESDASSVFKNLRKVADTYARGGTPGPLTLFSLSNSVKRLESELKNGRGMRDLKMLSNTCNDPNIVRSAMTDLMRRQGVPADMIDFIENMDRYKDILNQGLKQPAINPV